MVEPAPNNKNLNEEEGRSDGHRPQAKVHFAPTPPKSPTPSTMSVSSDLLGSVAVSNRELVISYAKKSSPRVAPPRPATGRRLPPPGSSAAPLKISAAGVQSSRAPVTRGVPPTDDFKTSREARSVSTETKMLPVRPDGKSSRLNVKSNDATT